MQGKVGHGGTGAGRWRPLGVGDWNTPDSCVGKVAKMDDPTVRKQPAGKGSGRGLGGLGAEPKGMAWAGPRQRAGPGRKGVKRRGAPR